MSYFTQTYERARAMGYLLPVKPAFISIDEGIRREIQEQTLCIPVGRLPPHDFAASPLISRRIPQYPQLPINTTRIFSKMPQSVLKATRIYNQNNHEARDHQYQSNQRNKGNTASTSRKLPLHDPILAFKISIKADKEDEHGYSYKGGSQGLSELM